MSRIPISHLTLYLLITFANSLEPDQARQYVGSDLGSNCLTMVVFLKEFFQKVNFEKKTADDKKHAKFPNRQKNLNAHIFCSS